MTRAGLSRFAVLRVTATATGRDEAARTQTTTLRDVSDAACVTSVEKTWLLHWFAKSGFSELATTAGLSVVAILAIDGQPAAPGDDEVAFWLRLPTHFHSGL